MLRSTSIAYWEHDNGELSVKERSFPLPTATAPVGATCRCLVAALSIVLFAAPSRADDPPPPSPFGPAWNWTGIYLGAHAGAFSGTTDFSDPNGASLYGGTISTPGFLAGLQLGYNHQLAPQWVASIEADASVLSSQGSNTCLQWSVTMTGSTCIAAPRALATLTGRLGFLTAPQGRTMLYAKGGLAWMRADYSINPNRAPPEGEYVVRLDPQDRTRLSGPPILGDPTSGSISAWGATLGAGVEHALSPAWSLKLEYNYLNFGGFGLPAPAGSNVTTSGFVSDMPSGFSHVTQNFHVAKLGLNYRFGAADRTSPDSPAGQGDAAGGTPWAPGWEIDVGGRYWYSWGKYQTSNGYPNIPVSRLTYSDVVGHSGELVVRVDTPIDVFVKGFIGGGGLSNGRMYDEDWGLPPEETRAEGPIAYEVTQADVAGTLHYLTADLGYNFMRGPTHKVGGFVGYHRYQTTMNAMGCFQVVQAASGVWGAQPPATYRFISHTHTWLAGGLGVWAVTRLWDRIKIAGDIAWLPWVSYNGVDTHWGSAIAPVTGTGNGVQAELFLSWLVTEAFTLSIGGRYWGMWTTNAHNANLPTDVFNLETDRYGVLLQASYKFRAPR